jgi:16S rRNA (adenine1518-N6/adenine1519-N6)-dimethyltransferase
MNKKLPPRKRFGQHFLHDTHVINQILRSINIQPNNHIVEIGPGHGALTDDLVKLANRIDLIELDRDLIPELKNKYSYALNMHIYQADVLRFDFKQLVSDQPLRIIGNLPYNISTPLLIYLLQFFHRIQDMHFMLQKEVAIRLAAPLGSKAYGRLSVIMQYHCAIDLLFTVGPEAFEPQPQVNSAFVRLTPLAQPKLIANNPKVFSDLVRRAFSQRRKTIHNNLKQLISDEQLQSLNIDPKMRPEQLSLEHFVKISNIIASL